MSIQIPLLSPQLEPLERTLESVVYQVYPGWELCICCDGSTEDRIEELLSRYQRLDERIKVVRLEQSSSMAGSSNATLSLASGEFAGFLSPGDELAPDALFEMARVLQEHARADIIYSDEDEIDEEGNRIRPRFKPDWAPDLLLSFDYVARLTVYRRSLLEEIGGFSEGFNVYQDYDLILRATERTDRIRHIPKVLYHRRASTGSSISAFSNGSRTGVSAHRALSEALERRDIEGSVEDGLLPDTFRVRPKIKGEPKVSLIIPTRDNVPLLKNCLESIERLTTYPNYEIIIIDNDSSDPATIEYLASTPHRIITFREPFNYSKINNAGVSKAEGEYVLLLNDDTEVISAGWLEAMLEHAQRLEVGAVGAKLVYPDGRIQHAGVLTGVGGAWGPGVATHSHQFYPSTAPGYLRSIAVITNYSAVTAACMLLRKSVFEEIGGFDEENLRVSFNDVDLCLRIRAQGYRIVYTPYTELLHHESVSRGYKGDPAEILYMRTRWGEVLDKDPYLNPNFSKGSGDFNLRADMLRPRVLLPETERPHEDSEALFKDALMAQGEKLKEYIETQQAFTRGTYRTALVPARGDKGLRIPPREELERKESYDPLRNQQTQGIPSRPTDDRKVQDFRTGALLRTEQFIWMFGSPRTGSTWLSRMMAELENQERWHEPYVGLLFGSFLYERLEGNSKLLNEPTFILGEPYRKAWLDSIRNFVIEGAVARYPHLRDDQYLVIKEPNGSLGAPLLLEATPDSRLIFLIRDPRDVIASRLDAFEKGSWSSQNRDYDTVNKLHAFTKHLAEDFFKVVSQVQRAYQAHQGKKVLVRYEDLREDTIGTLETMYGALGIEVDKVQLEAAVAKHSWEQIPDSVKGSGKFYRKAAPGGWREDLSPDQIKLVEDITGPILSEFY
jgi:GT2 family glycosyltransferase